MIQIKGKVCDDIDEILEYFEPTVRHMTNMFMSKSAEIEDCRQQLRIRIWEMYLNEERTFNSAYVSRRLKFDTINFINRDIGYKFFHKFTPIDRLTEQELDQILGELEASAPPNIELEITLKDLLDKSSDKLTDRQRECFALYLSGMDSEMIQKFLGKRSRNLTRYYLLVAEALSIIREVADEEECI